jgi:membrane-bound ClpP family serine protease
MDVSRVLGVDTVYKLLFQPGWISLLVNTLLGMVLGVVVMLLVAWLFALGVVEFIVGVIAVSVVTDFAMVWFQERAIAQGRLTLHNDIIGRHGLVTGRFVAHGDVYRGTVTLGHERWNATSKEALQAGEGIIIVARDGLLVRVARRCAS